MTKEELFGRFKAETKEVAVKAWDNDKVTIRKLTIREASEVKSLLMNNATSEQLSSGKLEISVGLLEHSQYLAVSYALVTPKLTIEEIESLPTDALTGISEIHDAINEWDVPKKSKGASSSSK